MSQLPRFDSSAMERAAQLLRNGQTVEAEAILVEAASLAESRFGTGSPEHASALYNLATILVNVGQQQQAIEVMRIACAGPMPPEGQSLRERLTHLMNLGEMLTLADELDEAEAVLRQGLAGRLNYYGREHPGYAFGLESLAWVLLVQGKLEEALQTIDEAFANFWQNGHEKIASTLALRAEILKAGGLKSSAFEGLDNLSDEMVEELVYAVFSRQTLADPRLLSSVLLDLANLLSKRFGEEHQLTLNTYISLANLERQLGEEGNHQIRQIAIRKVVSIYQRQGLVDAAIPTLLALAEAQSEAKDLNAALKTYNEVLAQAKDYGESTLLAQVLRDYGLFLAETDRQSQAEVLLREAVTVAAQGQDREMYARAQIALGIFLQHSGQLEAAKPLLTQGIAQLDSSHPDAVCSRSHLQAIETGEPCCSQTMSSALSDAFREFLLKRYPQQLLEDLLEDIQIQDDREFSVSVSLKRKPREVEMEELNRIINHALEEFRQQIKSRL